MNEVELTAAFVALRAEIGSECYLAVSLNIDPWESKEAAQATVYTEGIMRTETMFRVYAPTFEELIGVVRTAWEKNSKSFEAKIIRDMALAVIRITAEMGQCTDASLRSAGFDKDKIAKFAKKAAKDANTIAANGPFSVIIGQVNENV